MAASPETSTPTGSQRCAWRPTPTSTPRSPASTRTTTGGCRRKSSASAAGSSGPCSTAPFPATAGSVPDRGVVAPVRSAGVRPPENLVALRAVAALPLALGPCRQGHGDERQHGEGGGAAVAGRRRLVGLGPQRAEAV